MAALKAEGEQKKARARELETVPSTYSSRPFMPPSECIRDEAHRRVATPPPCGDSPGFEVAATYTNIGQCVTQLDETERSVRAPTTAVTRDARTSLSVLFREKTGHYGRGMAWLCAPDTVDPRGPKGGGR